MKFLYSYFDPQTGKSIVILADKYGIYTGQAKLHPADKNFISQITGGRLAEQRAQIKCLQSKYKRKKIELKTIQKLNKDIKINCKNIDPKIQRRINLKLRDYTNEINEIKNNIFTLQKDITEGIKLKDKILKNKNNS